MKHCLAVIRIGAYIGVFGMFVVIGACGHILFFMSQARLLKWIAFFAQWWARVTCLIFNIQIHIEGDANIKSGENEFSKLPGLLKEYGFKTPCILVDKNNSFPDFFITGIKSDNIRKNSGLK